MLTSEIPLWTDPLIDGHIMTHVEVEPGVRRFRRVPQSSFVMVGPAGPTGATGPEGSFSHSTLSYSTTTNLDFDADDYRSVTLAGNIMFTTSNRGAPKALTIRIIGDGSTRTLAFPVGWKFVGAAAPASLAANKVAILSVTCFGTTDADIIAAYSAEP